MNHSPLKTYRQGGRMTRLAAPFIGLMLLGVGVTAQAGIDVRAPFTHVGVDRDHGVNVRAPFTNVHAGGHNDHRSHWDNRRNDRRSHGYRHDDRRRDSRNYRYDRRSNYGHDRYRHDNRYDRYQGRYADHRDNDRRGLFGWW